MDTTPQRWQQGIPVPLQRSILFLAGLGLLIFEAAVRVGEPRWPLLVVYAGMMGSPLSLRADDIKAAITPPEEP